MLYSTALLDVQRSEAQQKIIKTYEMTIHEMKWEEDYTLSSTLLPPPIFPTLFFSSKVPLS
jgi:hypothetical protein